MIKGFTRVIHCLYNIFQPYSLLIFSFLPLPLTSFLSLLAPPSIGHLVAQWVEYSYLQKHEHLTVAILLEKCLSISINGLLHINVQKGVLAWQGVCGPNLVQVITTTLSSRVHQPSDAQNSASVPSFLWLFHSFFPFAIIFPEPRSGRQWFHLRSSIQQLLILMLVNYESLPLLLPTSKRSLSDQTKVTTILTYRHKHNDLEGNLMTESFSLSKTSSLIIGPMNTPVTGFG